MENSLFYTQFSPLNAGSRWLGLCNFKIFWGSMLPDIPWKRALLIQSVTLFRSAGYFNFYWNPWLFFPHRFVFVVVKTSALERSLFLPLVLEREGVGTQAALFARFVTISWWTWFTSTRMEASTAADTTLRCSSPAVLPVMRWENLMSMLLFDRLCCFLVVRTVAITKWRTAIIQMVWSIWNNSYLNCGCRWK